MPAAATARRGIRLAASNSKPSQFPESQAVESIALDHIHLDARLQFRVDGLDPSYITELAMALEEGATLPPVTLYSDGAGYWVGDGNHRIAAALANRATDIQAVILEGNRAAARRHALGANCDHGRRRTQGDVRYAYARAVEEGDVAAEDVQAVASLLRCSRQWAERLTEESRARKDLERKASAERMASDGMTQRQIAEALGVGQKTISRWLFESKSNSSEMTQTSPPPQGDQPQIPGLPPVRTFEEINAASSKLRAEDVDGFDAATRLVSQFEEIRKTFDRLGDPCRVCAALFDTERARFLRDLQSVAASIQTMVGVLNERA